MPDARPPALPSVTSVTPTERLFTLDVLRGIALLGILIVNIHEFRAPELYAAIIGIEVWQGRWDADSIIIFLTQLLCSGRWAPVYSFLFGLGLQLMCTRFISRQISPVTTISRRLGVLSVFGLLHAAFFWYGDVLLVYSLLGFLVLLVHQVSARTTLLLAILLMLGLGAVYLGLGALSLLGEMIAPGSSQFDESDWIYRRYETNLRVYAEGSWGELFRYRWIDNLLFWGLSIFWAPLALACMLIGAWTVKAGYHDRLSGSYRYRQYLLPVCMAALAVAAYTALDMMGVVSNMAVEFLIVLPASVIMLPVLSVGYISYITWWVEQTRHVRCWQWLAATGRMPLTNYLAQSFLASALFYGYGLGWFGATGAFSAACIAITLYTAQVAFSTWWMKHHHYGPLEQVWRILSYGKFTP
ncbi:MAG: DUF418 domain-containing protein [Verrucomicrobiota bacterium]